MRGLYFVLWARQVLEETATLYYGTPEKVLHVIILFQACHRGSEEPAIQSTDSVIQGLGLLKYLRDPQNIDKQMTSR